MNNVLLRKLIEKKFFTPSTEIDISYRGAHFTGAVIVQGVGTFTVLSAELVGEDDVQIRAASIVDGKKIAVKSDAIVAIAGMDPERFAASCGISPSGAKIVEGKRRGRKPKNRPIEEEF